MSVTPSLDFASSRLRWIVVLLELVNERLLVQSWHSQVWSLQHRFLEVRPKCCLNYASECFNSAVDLHHDDDNVDVHFSTTSRLRMSPRLISAAAS